MTACDSRATRTCASAISAAAGRLSLALLAACADGGPERSRDGGDPPARIDEFVAGLGTWEEFSPPVPPADIAAGPETRGEQIVDGVTYDCAETPYSLTDTPRELVMFEPNASIMWVGNLIQGGSYKDGQGSFEELSIRQRAPLRLSIDLLTSGNTAVVTEPSLTTVQAAIGELIQRASDAGHRSGSAIDYESRRINSTLEAALKMGLSAKFIGMGIPIELNASLDSSAQVKTRGVLAHFTQKMFTISVELPQSPRDFFTDALTRPLLQEQIDRGAVGPGNLPVYIASISYGRVLTYSLFSVDEEARIHAAVKASVTGFKNLDGSVYSEGDLKQTLSSEHLKVAAIGGEGINVINLIREGNLASYFTTDAALTSARPISYQLNFLGDNSIARVSETVSYKLRTCEEKQPVSPGRFDFDPVQAQTAGVPTPYTVLGADVDGDGRGDLVLSHLVSGVNRVRVGFGKTDGTFAFADAWPHPEASPAGGWGGGYETLAGDFDGDGDDDLVWSRRQDSQPDSHYVALSAGDGTFTALPVQSFAKSWATGWQTFVADLSGDGVDDLAFNYRNEDINRVAGAVSKGDGTFTLGAAANHRIAGNWRGYVTHVVRAVGDDTRADFVWNTQPLQEVNRTWLGRSQGDGTFDMSSGHQDLLSGWNGYAPHAGDINGDGRSDFAWVRREPDQLAIHRALTVSSTGKMQILQLQIADLPEGYAAELPPALRGDFNGDGLMDLLFNDLGASNRMFVGLGSREGDFTFTADQAHPDTAEDWTQFLAGRLAMDVDGDSVEDVVWTQPAATLRIHVARGR